MNKIVFLSVTALLLIKIVSSYRSEYSLPVKLGAIVIIGFLIISELSSLKDRIEGLLFFGFEDSNGYLQLIIKCILTATVTQLGCDICKDSGEQSISFLIESAGKIAILVICLPLVESLFSFTVGILGTYS